MLLIKIGKSVLKAANNNPVLQAIKKDQYEKKFIANKDLNLFKGIFPSFKDAEQSITYDTTKSYDNPDSAGMYKDNFKKLASGDYPNIFWLSKLITEHKSLFDFGGHIGVKYYNYSQYLDLADNFKWITYDLPEVVKEGRKIAATNDNAKHLSFADDMLEANDVDIFCAFGSLQYIDISLSDFLKSLKSMPKKLIITIPTSKNKDTYYTVNSIGTAFCPYIIRNENDFIESLTSLGYKLKQDWDVPEKKCEIPYCDPEYSLDYYRGFLFELN